MGGERRGFRKDSVPPEACSPQGLCGCDNRPMSDENQIVVPPSFIALFVDPGRTKPNASREHITGRYEFCEALATMLVERAQTLQWQLGVTEAAVLEKMHAGLQGPDAPVPHARRRKGAIVVVDDNADAREMVAEALRAAGHEVESMATAYEALARIPTLNPDVAILDIGMPGMDGYQLARSLRDASSGWTGRLIALTGYGQEADKARSLNAGFSLHLTKPIEVSDLLGAVESVIRPPAGGDGASS